MNNQENKTQAREQNKSTVADPKEPDQLPKKSK